MIMKGNQRGNARQLANHLTSDENDHHRILKVDGFCADNLHGALIETYAISKATQCKKIFFTVVISPPENVAVSEQQIFDVPRRIQEKFKLEKQPFALVEHEKEGRKHYHLVISRIDTASMKALELGLYKKALNELSLSLFIENKWDIPKGFQIGQPDSRNFSLAEWQQSKRLGAHPKHIKAAIKQSWDNSDNRASFKAALAEKGIFLAKGDRRNCFVAVTWQGETIPLNKKNLGATAKAIKSKLGAPETAQSIKAVKATIAIENYGAHKRLRRELAIKHKIERQPLTTKKRAMVKHQRQERADLSKCHQARTHTENQARQQSMRKGIRGLWDFITGQSSKQKQRNEIEANACALRDTTEREALMNRHINDRQQLQKQINTLKDKHQLETMALNASFVKHSQGLELTDELKQAFDQISQSLTQSRTIHHKPENRL
jgi:hypothetical protein